MFFREVGTGIVILSFLWHDLKEQVAVRTFIQVKEVLVCRQCNLKSVENARLNKVNDGLFRNGDAVKDG